MMRMLSTLVLSAALLLIGGCPKRVESAPESPQAAPGTETAEIEVAKAPPESSADAPTPRPSILATPEITAAPGEATDLMDPAMPDLDTAASKTAQVSGSYRDSTAPEVLYELRPDGTWQATWQAPDGEKGLRMKGTYKVEYGMARLLCTAVARKDPLSRDFKRERVPPAPQPRCVFTVADDTLFMVPDMADPAFLMTPFTATQLKKLQ
ncbi:MAG: hypothetical protein ACOYOL_10255 [Chthoniobacterales bacterium]